MEKENVKKGYYQITKIAVLFIVIFSIVGCYYTPTKAAQASGLSSSTFYSIRNKNSGKYLNVNFGNDANGTNVTQYTRDGSLEQRFKLMYDSSSDSYKIYAACSSNGTNRVLDVLRVGGSASGAIQSGCNVDIWAPNDNEAQRFTIISRGSGYYSIHLKSNTNLALTAYGTGNGSGAGTSSTSAGNVYASTYTGANSQLWSFERTDLFCYYYTNTNAHSVTTTDIQYYAPKMSYNANLYKNADPQTILNTISNSEIAIYYGHGYPGNLFCNGQGNLYADYSGHTSLSNLSNGSLNKTKLVMFYCCYGGVTSDPRPYGNLVDTVVNKGAKCGIGWTKSVYEIDITSWNTGFLESACNHKSIASSINDADVWFVSGTAQGNPYSDLNMHKNIYVKGDTSIIL